MEKNYLTKQTELKMHAHPNDGNHHFIMVSKDNTYYQMRYSHCIVKEGDFVLIATENNQIVFTATDIKDVVSFALDKTDTFDIYTVAAETLLYLGSSYLINLLLSQ